MKSLAGIRIAVTRPEEQSVELAAALQRAGATVHVCPLIRIEGIVDVAEWRHVRERLGAYTWLVFTSANGVDRFVQLLHEANIEPTAMTGCRVACVGPVTANVAQARGFSVSLIPDQYLGAVVADALADAGPLAGQKILIARAAGGGAELPAGLRAHGAEVDDFELYRSVPDEAGAARLRALMSDGNVDLLTFTSGSAVTYFVEKIGNPADMAVAVIGPSTAQVARRLGVRVDIEADPHTTAGLIKAIIDYYAADGGESEV